MVAVTGLGAEPSEDSAWQDLREWRFTEAARSFEHAGNEPASRLGLAVAGLNLRPRTAERLARAEEELTALAGDASVDADVAAMASYLLARIAEVHAFAPDPARAADLYAALLASHPRHPAAQLAVSRLATLRLYRLGADPSRTLAELEPLAGQLTDAGARRDFHLVLGRSYLFFGGERQRALEHLQTALAAGIVAPTVRADVLAQIGEVASELRRPAIAREAWSEFLTTSPRDLPSTPLVGVFTTADRTDRGDDPIYTDLFFTYERQLPRDVRWRVQLNISNVFDRADPLPVAAINSADTANFSWVPYRHRPVDGRVVTLTNTFSF